MVTEFVRTMYQDKKGNYWFGTNTNGIIRYDGDTLENVTIEQKQNGYRLEKLLKIKLAISGLGPLPDL
jgi:ligand-binding sensor domain-containing protein